MTFPAFLLSYIERKTKDKKGLCMKKGNTYKGTVEKVSFPNKCLVRVEGEEKSVILKDALPGEEVVFSATKVRSSGAEGRLISIDKKSDMRLNAPMCPHFGACGGCTYQDVNSADQLKLKAEQIKELLEPVLSAAGADFGALFEGIEESPLTKGYRNKMEFSFGDEFKGGPLSLGMHKKGSFYDIVTVSGCIIMHSDMRLILKATLDYFSEREIPYCHKNTHEGYLRHLLVRRAAKTGEILCDIVTSTDLPAGVNEDELLCGYADVLKSLEYEGNLTGVLHTRCDSVADVIKDEGTDILFGQDFFFEELLGLKFKITPFSFFQTNSLGAEVLYSAVREYAKSANASGVIYDLYSGTGTIAQLLAPVAKEVIGVEIVEEAVVAAGENARMNGLSNCRFLAGDVLKCLDDIETLPDFIILDPPREGINPKALSKIVNYGVNNIVYISCKPTSLAKDLVILQSAGYKAKRIKCVNMFPATVHLETCVLLSKTN